MGKNPPQKKTKNPPKKTTLELETVNLAVNGRGNQTDIRLEFDPCLVNRSDEPREVTSSSSDEDYRPNGEAFKAGGGKDEVIDCVEG